MFRPPAPSLPPILASLLRLIVEGNEPDSPLSPKLLLLFRLDSVHIITETQERGGGTPILLPKAVFTAQPAKSSTGQLDGRQ